jgi:hypothetical protein
MYFDNVSFGVPVLTIGSKTISCVISNEHDKKLINLDQGNSYLFTFNYRYLLGYNPHTINILNKQNEQIPLFRSHMHCLATWADNNCKGSWAISWYTFAANEQEDAVLFKLTWC